MKNIQILQLNKYNDKAIYESKGNGIYKDLNDPDDSCFRIAFSFELEEGEDSQYPLEDILDKYLVHVSDFLEDEQDGSSNLMKLELGGELSCIQHVAGIAGKRAYNQDFVGDDGRTYVNLIIAWLVI